jgi:hypothetical protein
MSDVNALGAILKRIAEKPLRRITLRSSVLRLLHEDAEFVADAADAVIAFVTPQSDQVPTA